MRGRLPSGLLAAAVACLAAAAVATAVTPVAVTGAVTAFNEELAVIVEKIRRYGGTPAVVMQQLMASVALTGANPQTVMSRR